MLFFRSVFQTVRISHLSPKVLFTAFPSYVPNSCRNRMTVLGKFFSVKASTERNTLNEEEILKFQNQSENWWNPKTTFGGLIEMNRLRVPFVRDGILSTCTPPKCEKTAKPLQGFTILDVGCGGGLLSEPLARLGASVTGLDPIAENIEAAQKHAELDFELKNNLEYMCGTVEDLSKDNIKYNAVVCSEVIEHVNNPDLFVKSCVDVLEDNGSIFFTTINRTAFSYVSTILIAEYVLGILPRGTHDWKKFISPYDLKDILQSLGCRTLVMHGMIYNPMCRRWSWLQYDGGSYALHAVKERIVSDV